MDKLLIVDDEDAILKQLKWAFKNDYDIITASSADKAISAVREHSPAVMILDLSLTDDASRLEGFEVLETALSIAPAIKVVMITGHDDMENAIIREKRLKKWNRAWKLRLIEQTNPDWDDLYESIL